MGDELPALGRGGRGVGRAAVAAAVRGGVGVAGDGDATRGKWTLNQRAWGQPCHQQEAHPLPP